MKTYSTSKSVWEAEKNFETYASQGLDGITTTLNGRSILALFFIATFLIFSQSLAMQVGNILPKLSYKINLTIILMLILSIITSEIIVTMLFNKEEQHPIIYPFLILHGVFIIYLMSNILQNKNKGLIP